MKKLGIFVLLVAGLAFAQDASQSQPSAAQAPAATQSSTAQQTDVGKPTDTDENLFKGCLGGTKDNYTLTDDKGQTFRLHSDKDINEHVGNMVEIKGTLKKEGLDNQKSTDASAASTGAAAGTGTAASTAPAAQQEIDVADVKDVSKGCSADANKSK